MTQKFNIGDRVVVSNPGDDAAVREFEGDAGAVTARSVGHDPALYRVELDGFVPPVHLYANELARIEEES